MGDEYEGGYEQGRSGAMYTGRNSIDYAGYLQGDAMRRQAEGGGGGGGGGGPINFKGKVMQFAIVGMMLGGMLGLLFSHASWLGFVIGAAIGGAIGAALRLMIAAIAWPLKMLLRLLPFALSIVVGYFVGLAFGAVASDQWHSPREQTMMQFGVTGAGIFFVLWALRRLTRRKRPARGMPGGASSLLVAFGAVALLLSNSCTPKVDTDAMARALTQLDEEWSKAAATKNAATVASYYAADAVAYAPNEPMAMGQPSAEKVWASYFADSTFSISWKTDNAGVAQSGDLGFTTGTYVDSFKKPDGTLVTENGKYVCIWAKQADGKWKAVHDIWNTDSK